MNRFLVLFVLSFLLVSSATAQPKTDREQYGLAGPVKKVVIETAKLSNKFGKWEEEGRKPAETLTFNAQGNLTEHETYAPDGTLKSEAVYTYDSQGNKTEENAYTSPLVRLFKGTLQFKDVYTYDAQGNLIEEAAYAPDGALKSKDVHTYDAKENLTEEDVYTPSGTPKSRALYAYDAKGNRTENKNLYTPDGVLKAKEVRTYDVKGNLIEDAFYAPDLQKKEAYSYEDGSFGNWIKMTTATWVTKFGKSYFEPSMVTHRTITYYGEGAK